MSILTHRVVSLSLRVRLPLACPFPSPTISNNDLLACHVSRFVSCSSLVFLPPVCPAGRVTYIGQWGDSRFLLPAHRCASPTRLDSFDSRGTLKLTMRTHVLIGSLKPGPCSLLTPRLLVRIHRPITSLTCNSRFPHSSFHTSPIQCRKGNPMPKNDPVAEFFARFPDFKYNPDCTWPEEWRKLSHNIEEQLQRAAIERFQSTYSFDPSDLAAWHKMCRVVGIIPPPPTHKGCKRVRGPSSVCG